MIYRITKWAGRAPAGIVGLVAVLAFLVPGCGGGHVDASTTGSVTRCSPIAGSTSTVVIRHANLTCEQAEAFMIILPNSPGEFPITTQEPGESPVPCRVFSSQHAPVAARCFVGGGVIELVEAGA